MQIRHKQGRDCARVAEIRALATRELRRIYRPAPGRGGAEGARSEHLPALVAVERQVVVGVVEYRLCSGSLHLQGLAVHPGHRRRGIARALINAADALARRESRPSITLSTIAETGNPRIFARLGFTVVARRTAARFEGLDGAAVTQVDMCRRLD